MHIAFYRQIGLLASIFGFIGIVFNVLMENSAPDPILFQPYILITTIACLFMLVLSLIPQEVIRFHFYRSNIVIPIKKMNMLLQFLIFFILSTLLILIDDKHSYMMTLVLVVCFLGNKYKIIRYRGTLLVLVYFSFLTVIAAFLYDFRIEDIKDIFYTICYYMIILLLFREELRHHYGLMVKYHDQAIRVTRKLQAYEKESLNPETFKLTPRESEVLEFLCIYNASNQEIGVGLGIKQQTVKTHLGNIFEKAGVEDRHQLIDLCRWYFMEKIQPES